eukprot:14242873-Alexandrium_andersonii.AAC.1
MSKRIPASKGFRSGSAPADPAAGGWSPASASASCVTPLAPLLPFGPPPGCRTLPWSSKC